MSHGHRGHARPKGKLRRCPGCRGLIYDKECLFCKVRRAAVQDGMTAYEDRDKDTANYRGMSR